MSGPGATPPPCPWHRGILCGGCNRAEGASGHPIYQKYRERHPASMLGIYAQCDDPDPARAPFGCLTKEVRAGLRDAVDRMHITIPAPPDGECLMAYLTSQRVARKTYDCSTCTGKIRAGERYKRTAIPPGDNDIGNTDWWTVITHLTPGQCYYENSLLQPGERNPCTIDNVTMTGGATPNQGMLVVDCACGEAFSVPQGGDEDAAITVAFAAHVREIAIPVPPAEDAVTSVTAGYLPVAPPPQRVSPI